MSDGMAYADIIIIALVAGFILLRLRAVLGRKDDADGDVFRPRPPQSPAESDTVIQLGPLSQKAKPREIPLDPYAATLEGGAITDGIAAIKARDPLFTATAFLSGAKMAFEMVFDAFAKGDKATLALLLSPEIYADFSDDVDARAVQAEKPETTLLSVKAREIASAVLDKNMARLAVRFDSEQVTVARDASGAIVSGDPSAVHHSQDEWVFERDITSKNPNWKIVET